MDGRDRLPWPPHQGGSAIDALIHERLDVFILVLLSATAVIIVRTRELFTAVMLTGIYSLLGASWMLTLDAPDVAFTEAAVGAGLSTVLMLSTLALVGVRAKKLRRRPLAALAIVTVTGGLLIFGTTDMPQIGDPNAPAQTHPSPSYVERAHHEFHVPNIVTAVLGSYRGYDTLGETTVIFTAGIGVICLLRGLGARRREEDPS